MEDLFTFYLFPFSLFYFPPSAFIFYSLSLSFCSIGSHHGSFSPVSPSLKRSNSDERGHYKYPSQHPPPMYSTQPNTPYTQHPSGYTSTSPSSLSTSNAVSMSIPPPIPDRYLAQRSMSVPNSMESQQQQLYHLQKQQQQQG